VPVESHCWGCEALHCFAPGVQVPEQVAVALLQMYWQAVPMFAQVPVESQTCGCRPLHCFAPGVQAPPHVAVALLQTN
jgi:hypothetical protein